MESDFFVLLHGINRMRRGKPLSATFMNERNPKKAFEKAKEVARMVILLPLMAPADRYSPEFLEAVERRLGVQFPLELRMTRFEGYGPMRELFETAKKRKLNEKELAFLRRMRTEVELDREGFSNPDDGEEGAYVSCCEDLNQIDAILTGA